MAVKFFCDGCDREMSVASLTKINVTGFEEPNVGCNGNHDLCDSCVHRMVRNLPKNWTRVSDGKY